MQINVIVAVCDYDGIGKNGDLPWTLRSDLRHFARLTKRGGSSAIVMGRNTWNSLPRQPLPGRINVVISKTLPETDNEGGDDDGVVITPSLTMGIDRLRKRGNVTHCWIIGGARLYREAFSLLSPDRIYLTRIQKHYDCDVFLPPIPYFRYVETNDDEDVLYDDQMENDVAFYHRIYTRRV